MMTTGVARQLCAILAILTAAPAAFAQKPAESEVSAPLSIKILEGNNAINSVPLLRSIAPVIEVRDENDFPLEGADVVFKLPDHGPGGTFATGGLSFTTRTDSHGQAAGPLIVPKTVGKFQIKVTANLGNRTADTVVNQTNVADSYFGATAAPKPWYRRRKPLLLVGGAVVAGGVVAIILLTRGSSSNTVGITPGPPVFH